MTFEVGDIVTVDDREMIYEYYADWVEKYATNLEEFWVHGRNLRVAGSTWQVCAKGMHEYKERGMLYFIVNTDEHSSYYTQGYIINEKGLKLLKSCEECENEDIDINFNKTVVLI